MRRKLLAVAALTAAGLAATALFPPIVAGEEYESATPGPAWRWLFPTHLEWAWIGDGRLYLPDFGELVPWRIAIPTLALEGLLLCIGASLALAWVLAHERWRREAMGDRRPGAFARFGPPACLLALLALAAAVSLARIPWHVETWTRADSDPLQTVWELPPPPGPGWTGPGQVTPPRTAWAWEVETGIRGGINSESTWTVFVRRLVWDRLAARCSALLLVGALAAWLGIVRPRRKVAREVATEERATIAGR